MPMQPYAAPWWHVNPNERDFRILILEPLELIGIPVMRQCISVKNCIVHTEIAPLGGPSQAIGSVLAIDLSRIHAPTDFGRSAHQDENFFDVKDGIEFSGEDHDLMAVVPLASLATNTALGKFLAGLGAIGIGQVENG